MSTLTNETSVSTKQPLWKKLGPGLITGAADDDPSGIATYSQAGAGYGYGLLWTTFFTYPLMVGIQTVSARIGRVTGHGLASNLRRHYPRWLLYSIVSLLLAANTVNIAADIGAMGAALKLMIGGSAQAYAIAFGVMSLLLQVFVPFPRYAPLLKLMTLALLSYVATLFVIEVPWKDVLHQTLLPWLSFKSHYLTAVVAVFGTTISPYLFFWQASQEVEEVRMRDGVEPLVDAPEQARQELRRIKIDTYVGMGFSNIIAFCIMLTAGVTLHDHGIADIQSSAQAAEALSPVAGQLAAHIFAIGIIGTGLLAVPVLAGSAAYAAAEALDWPMGLAYNLPRAKGFYTILAIATLCGVALNFMPVDPIRALYWSAVVNGIIAVPIMAVMMLMAVRADIMGPFVIKRRLRALGWLATTVMGLAVMLMAYTA